MIERVEIFDFQKHHRLMINLDPEATVLRGANGSGKSCVLRAIKWVVTGKPSGGEMVRWGAERCKVRLKIGDVWVERERDKGTNIYRVDGEEFKVFGQGVPDAVTKLLGMEGVNFQGQHDAAFWFSLSAGALAAQLNELVNLEAIDKVVKISSRRKRAAKADHEAKAVALRQARQQMAGLGFGVSMASDLRRLEEAEERRARAASRSASLRGGIQHLKSYQEKKKALGGLLEALRGQRDRVGNALANAKAVADRVRALDDLVGSCDEARHNMNRSVWAKRVNLDVLESRVEEMRGMAQRVGALRAMVKSVKNSWSAADSANAEYQAKLKELRELTGDRCPICGGDYDAEADCHSV